MSRLRGAPSAHAIDPLEVSDAAPVVDDRGRLARACRGLAAVVWCSDKPFAASTLRVWASRLRRADAPAFLELRPRATSPVTRHELVVEVGDARVRVTHGFDPALLASVVAVLERLDRGVLRVPASTAEGATHLEIEGAQLAFEAMFEQVRKLSEQLDAAADAASKGARDDAADDVSTVLDRGSWRSRDHLSRTVLVQRLQ